MGRGLDSGLLNLEPAFWLQVFFLVFVLPNPVNQTRVSKLQHYLLLGNFYGPVGSES